MIKSESIISESSKALSGKEKKETKSESFFQKNINSKKKIVQIRKINLTLKGKKKKKKNNITYNEN